MSKVQRTILLVGGVLCLQFAIGAATAKGGPQQALEAVFVRDPAMRATPIQNRPNRLGHVYGNTYRRMYYGEWMVNPGRHPKPVATYLYLN